MFILYFYFVLFVTNINGDSKCDKSKCIGEQKLYKEIGCRPIIKKGNCCASRYECPDFTTLDDQKCHFMNESFEVGSELPGEITHPSCEASCSCREGYKKGPVSFQCAQIECPEHFSPEPDCIYQVEEGQCCSDKKVCGCARKQLSKCVLDGREYYEGQSMYPDKESCYTCICAKDFDNNTIIDNPHCNEIGCDIQLRRMWELQTGCVPVYYKTSNCCPIYWRCPEKNDKVVRKGKSKSKNKCSFGKLKLNVGDELSAAEKGVTCTCVTPPFVQCIKS